MLGFVLFDSFAFKRLYCFLVISYDVCESFMCLCVGFMFALVFGLFG